MRRLWRRRDRQADVIRLLLAVALSGAGERRAVE
jgi:hypothetical protein